MTLQAIIYRGRLVAACTRRQFFLAEPLEHRPPDDPERTLVVLDRTASALRVPAHELRAARAATT
jgi:hypothetical protein